MTEGTITDNILSEIKTNRGEVWKYMLDLSDIILVQKIY